MTAPALLEEEVLETLEVLPSEQKEHLRLAAKSDLYFLSKGVLGYADVNPQTHGAFCRFIQGQEKLRRLGLMPRGHLKSTIATIADSVRLALIDPDNARILIAGETATTAEKFLSEIKGHFERNKLLQQLFPELIPQRFSGPGVQWSTSFATLPRATSWKEATWSAIGVGGAAVGSHFTRIKGDDLIGFEALRSPAVMSAAIAWVENIEPLLVDQNTDIIDFIGTRWARIDLYSRIMKLYGSDLAVFVREAIENGEVIFPQKHTMARYEQMQRETPSVWFSQYCNNPVSAGYSDFPSDGINSFRFGIGGEVVLRLENGQEKVWQRDDLDIIMTADPNSGQQKSALDPAAIVVSAVSPDDEVIVLHSESSIRSPSGFVDRIFELYLRWRPRVVGIEQAGQQNTHFYFDKKSAEEEVYIRTIALKPKGRNKEARIRTALEPLFRSKRIWVLPTQTALRKMVAEFPDTDPIDELDSLSYGTEEGMWRKPYRQQDQEEKQAVLKLIVNRRSKRTGY